MVNVNIDLETLASANLIVWGILKPARNLLAADIFGQPSRAGFDPLCGALRTVLHLRTLRLGYCGLDDGEAEGVAAFLASSVRLESLDLSGNQARTTKTACGY